MVKVAHNNIYRRFIDMDDTNLKIKYLRMLNYQIISANLYMEIGRMTIEKLLKKNKYFMQTTY